MSALGGSGFLEDNLGLDAVVASRPLVALSPPLADLMRAAEDRYRVVLPPRGYYVLRVDGRAFHTYLCGAARPFDETFAGDLDAVARALCAEVSGALFAYSQSDEVSVIHSDLGRETSRAWFGGVVAKQVSVGASIATGELISRRGGTGSPTFDARAFRLDTPDDVRAYLTYRQRDAVRNSIQAAAQARFSPRRMHGCKCDELVAMLADDGVDWHAYPQGFRCGRLTVKRDGVVPVEYVDRRTKETVSTTALRSWWETEPAPQTYRDGEPILRGIASWVEQLLARTGDAS